MATIDLRTLPLSEQHHSLAFNDLGRTGRSPYDFLWICPECDDGVTHAPMTWSGGTGYVHYVPDEEMDWDAQYHKLVAVDVIAVLEAWRQIGCHLDGGTRWEHVRDSVVGYGVPSDALSRTQATTEDS